MPRQCAYCGLIDRRMTRDHVIPKSLYPKSIRRGKFPINLITVPSCVACNRSWADDEPHFRSILGVAGDEPNLPRQELWTGPTIRSFQQIDGLRRMMDLVNQFHPVQVEGIDRFMVYPARDPRVMRIIRKIVRGLCHHKSLRSPVPDELVWADINLHNWPQDELNNMHYLHCEPDIFQCHYKVVNQDNIVSIWILEFFERCSFNAAVLKSSSLIPNQSPPSS